MSDTFIYALVDPRDGAVRYIGKTKRGMFRPETHRRATRSVDKNNLPKRDWILDLKRAGLEYQIRILAHCDLGDLDAAEQYCIAYFKHQGAALLNRSNGGAGPLGMKHSRETLEKMSASQRARPPATPETRNKISTAKKGKSPSAQHRLKIATTLRNRGSTPEQIEHLAKIRKLLKGRAVVDGTGRRYASLQAAARACGVFASNVRAVALGRQAFTGAGHTFRFVDENFGKRGPRKSVPSIPVRVNLISRDR